MRSAWPNYLDALEGYLELAAHAVAHGRKAPVPPTLASRPTAALPVEHRDRAARLLAEIERVAAIARARRAQVISARSCINDRRRIARPRGRSFRAIC